MIMKNSLPQFALGALTALAIVVALGWVVSPAWASSSAPRRSSASSVPAAPAGFDGQSPLNVPAASFRPDGNSTTHYYFGFLDGYMHGTDPANKACVMAPVYLPVGAVIDRVYASVVDNEASPNWSMEFRRVNVLSGANVLLASFTTDSTGTGMKNPGADLTANNVVPSQYYSYYLGTCLSTNQRLYGARVYYDVNQVFTPLIERQ